MRRLALACAFLAAFAAAAPTDAQNPARARVTITGTVTDTVSGAPVAGASVTIARTHRTVWTDDHGRFMLPGVDPGDDWLLVQQLGYENGQVAIRVADGMPSLAVTLVPDPVLLEGLAVIALRPVSRPGAWTMGMHAFDARDLQGLGPWDVASFMRNRGGIFPVSCYSLFGTMASIGAATAPTCVWARGQFQPTRVFLDDMELFGGLEALAGIALNDVYRIEVYERGAFIQVLTKRWALRAAERGGRFELPPFF